MARNVGVPATRGGNKPDVESDCGNETPCEPVLLFFAGMNNHLIAAGLLEPLKSGEPTPKKISEAIQTLFAAMNEVQELVASRLG